MKPIYLWRTIEQVLGNIIFVDILHRCTERAKLLLQMNWHDVKSIGIDIDLGDNWGTNDYLLQSSFRDYWRWILIGIEDSPGCSTKMLEIASLQAVKKDTNQLGNGRAIAQSFVIFFIINRIRNQLNNYFNNLLGNKFNNIYLYKYSDRWGDRPYWLLVKGNKFITNLISYVTNYGWNINRTEGLQDFR